MSKTNFLENQILKHLASVASWTAPSTLYIGLFSAAPNDAGGGTELSGNGYSRQVVSLSVVSDTASNSGALSFTSNALAWSAATYAGLFDDPTAGNLLWYTAMDAPETVPALGSLDFAIGALTFHDD